MSAMCQLSMRPGANATWKESWAGKGSSLSGHIGGIDFIISNCSCLMLSYLSLYLASIREDTYGKEESSDKNEGTFFQ